MYKRDYILRLIEEFRAALERLLEKNDVRRREEGIKELYRQYVGDYTFYHTATVGEVLGSLEQFPENERLHRIDMLAQLYFSEAGLKSKPISDMLYEKALSLYQLLEAESKTFSFERISRIKQIKDKEKGRI